MAPPARLVREARVARLDSKPKAKTESEPFLIFCATKNGSPGQTRTGNLEVNSFLLHH